MVNKIEFTPKGAHAKFREQLWSERHDGNHIDVIITCGEETFPAHKGILTAQSKVFRAMLNGGFKEAQVDPSGTTQIDLPDDDPAIVEGLIHFMYLGSISFDTPRLQQYADANGHLMTLAMLYIIADKYDIVSLSAYSLLQYKKLLLESTPPVSSTQPTATMYCRFLRTIPVVYSMPSSKSESLRKVIMLLFQAQCAHMKKLITESEELREDFSNVIHDCPDFAEEILLEFMSAVSWIKREEPEVKKEDRGQSE